MVPRVERVTRGIVVARVNGEGEQKAANSMVKAHKTG